MTRRAIWHTVLASSALALVLGLTAYVTPVNAFPRYNDGCNSCHGSFTDEVSPQGTVFPGGSKHQMHRGAQSMNAECDLCHAQGDGNNPYINFSGGTSNNPGIGCIGCHQPEGLQRHHATSGVSCLPCHNPTSAPAESTVPTYYGTADSNVDNPCNAAGLPDQDENWSIGDSLGLDNDGDGFYDTADSDCMQAGTPGEVSDPAVQPLLVTTHDRLAGEVSLSYGMTCDAVTNDIVFGLLADVDTYGYSGATCNVGNSGATTWAYPTGSSFFLLVAQDGTHQGSYGTDGNGAERPAAGLSTCGSLTQDLAARCD